ncbi:MAG: 2-oxoacid:acceptor oxidoreductase family protein [Gammaproteobacteria bacterium]
MQQILIYGRGGQGAKLAGELIISSLFSQGRTVHGMPLYTGAKMGQPLVYSVKIDPGSDRALPTSHIDGIMVMHPNMLTTDVIEKTTPDCFVLINCPDSPESFQGVGQRVACVDANRIAREHGLVKANVPTVSTAMAGAFARVSGLFPFEVIKLAICGTFKRNAELNVEVAQRGFQEVRQLESSCHG